MYQEKQFPNSLSDVQTGSASTEATVHEGTKRICQRLASIVSNYESVIQRLSGPRPIEKSGEKDQREPSTMEFLQMAHRLISDIESQGKQLAGLIG